MKMMVSDLKMRFTGLLFAMLSAGAWATLVSLVIFLSGSGHESVFKKILGAFLAGMISGAGLTLLFHTFLRKILVGIANAVPMGGVFLLPVVILYYVLAWPGVMLGKAFGLYAPVGAKHFADDEPARAGRADKGLPSCPFAGTVYSNEGHPKFLYRIRRDWKVDLEGDNEWGFVDAKGQIRKYGGPNPFNFAGPPSSPWEQGWDPSDPSSLAGDGVVCRVDGELCLKGAYASDILGKLSRGDGALL